MRSKAECDPLLFSPEPPSSLEGARALWVGHSATVDLALDTLRCHMDVDGARTAAGRAKRPWVIHGESRSGKSHMARRVLADLADEPTRVLVETVSRSRGDAVAVMWDLFQRLFDQYRARMGEAGPLVVNRDFACTTTHWAERICEHFAYGAQPHEVTFESSGEHLSSSEGGASVWAAVGKHTTTTRDGNKTTHRVPPPTAGDLAAAAGALVDTMVRSGLATSVVFLVDDVDIVRPYRGAADAGFSVANELLGALADLHETPGADVLVTARTWYVESRGEFTVLTDLGQEDQLQPDELRQIHDLRVAQLGIDGDRQDQFLAAEALALAAKDCGGLPGVFLQCLDVAFQQYRRETDWQPRDAAWLLNVLGAEWRRLEREHPETAVRIRECAASGQVLDLSVSNPISATRYEGVFATPSYWSPSQFTVSPIVGTVLEHMAGGALP